MDTLLLYLIFFILVIALGYAAYKEFSKKGITSIPFKEAMDLISLPVVTFEHNGNKLHLMLDTGSDDSYINTSVLPFLDPVRTEKSSVPVITGAGETSTSGIVVLDLMYNNHRFINHFLIMNLDNAFNAITQERGIEIHGIIGNKFFKKYEYKLDFESMMAHSKKGVNSK